MCSRTESQSEATLSCADVLSDLSRNFDLSDFVQLLLLLSVPGLK